MGDRIVGAFYYIVFKDALDALEAEGVAARERERFLFIVVVVLVADAALKNLIHIFWM